jgi:hypothetical protein
MAKLDRLSRNLAFIAALMDSGVEFIAVDNPHASKLTIDAEPRPVNAGPPNLGKGSGAADSDASQLVVGHVARSPKVCSSWKISGVMRSTLGCTIIQL